MQKHEFDGVLTITSAGPRSLHKLVQEIMSQCDDGWMLDPNEREEYIVKDTYSMGYQVKLVRTDVGFRKELDALTPEEKVAYILEDEGKERLLKIAEVLEIDIPVSAKVPKQISKVLRDAVGEGNAD